ncbi:ABC transporter substrate-binding protein [Streptomyces sp. NPDC048479]|uniref:ABC transporter substrate-binding protein n=1 Tax=Streptomyces sp. NPDC048479 TaxID=3154725 RepID=UPI0034458DA9
MSAPVNRRTVLQGLGLGATATFLSACLPGETPSSMAQRPGNTPAPPTLAPGPPGSGRIRRGGRVITAWAEEPMTYDPAVAWDPQAWEAISTVLNTPLLQFDGAHGGPAPSAAADLPEISDDGRTYTLRLRHDVRFHNGRRVVADDYIYSWTRVLDPELASWASSYLLSIEGATAYSEGKAKRVSGLRRVDAHTLRVRLTAPDITFVHVLCQPYMAAVPREEVERLGKEFGRRPVGTGPFMSASYDGKARKSVFRRNPHYFQKGTPFIDTLEYRWGISSDLGLLQLRKGQIDVLGDGIPSSLGPQVRADPGLGSKYTLDVPVRATSWLAFNFGRPELRDRRVRQALNLATDRENLMKLTYGTQEPWGLPLPKELPGYRRTAKPYDYDPERAKSLLAAAGVRRLRLEFLHSGEDPWGNLSQVLQQQWSAVGVDLVLKQMSKSAFDEATYDKQGDVYPARWYMAMPNALDLAGQCFASDGSSNYTGYSNGRVDALLTQARRSTGEKQSMTAIARAEEILKDDAPAVFLSSLRFLAARSPRVRDYTMRGETAAYYDRLWVSE